MALRRARRGLWLSGHLVLGALICRVWLAALAAGGSRHARGQRQYWVRWWMRRLLRGLGVEVRTHGFVHATPELLVANHVSWLDIPCLLACTDAVFVAKAEVARWPLIGRLAAGAGTLFLDRGRGAGEIAARAGAALTAGENVMVFPEGTSTDGRGVRPFHARLFQAARAADVPVQAVAIRYPHPRGSHPVVPFIGEDSLVPHLWRLLGESRIDAELVFCPPRPAANRDRRTLAEEARGQIARVLTAAGPQPATVTPASSALQARVTPAGDHAGPRHPETRTWKSSETPANPAPGA
jgi:1-acyl-sn-glycerol-3-phosphate acyltransferase